MTAFGSESLIRRVKHGRPAELVRYSIGLRENQGLRPGGCEMMRQLRDCSEPQAYSIGILLIEIALRRKVTGFQEHPPELRIGGVELLGLEQAINILRGKLGSAFVDVVRSCFYEIRLPQEGYELEEEQKEHLDLEILHQFHDTVFIL